MNPESEATRRARSMWRYVGIERPTFAVTPGPGQESVWDYPRPPRVEADAREIVVIAHGIELIRTRKAVRVLETASPPSFYLPWQDVRRDAFVPAPGGSRCEWKGLARYWSIEIANEVLPAVAWSYEDPLPGMESLRDHVSLYPGRTECFVDGIRVLPQPGRFYGGWITPELAGPFKGEPGTEAW